MNQKKIAFFDIDGTLWDENNFIPESTKEAIRKIQEKGNLAFINTGRCAGFLHNPQLEALGFDGVVSGCGTRIEFQGKVIYNRLLDSQKLADTITTIRGFGFRPILEGPVFIYMDDAEFGNDFYGKKLKSELTEELKTIEDNWGTWEVNKFSCAMDKADRESCYKALEEEYDFLVHSDVVAEVVPKGFHKGKGIEKVCDLLQIPIENTYAFGDSVNDLGMFETAGTSICMGNGCDQAKKKATYITKSMMEDGILEACKHFDLI